MEFEIRLEDYIIGDFAAFWHGCMRKRPGEPSPDAPPPKPMLAGGPFLQLVFYCDGAVVYLQQPLAGTEYVFGGDWSGNMVSEPLSDYALGRSAGRCLWRTVSLAAAEKCRIALGPYVPALPQMGEKGLEAVPGPGRFGAAQLPV